MASAAVPEDVAALYQRHLSAGRAALSSMLGGVVEVASEGAWVVAADGERYLDLGGYAVFLLGHRHTRRWSTRCGPSSTATRWARGSSSSRWPAGRRRP